jgi:hypothetical protein
MVLKALRQSLGMRVSGIQTRDGFHCLPHSLMGGDDTGTDRRTIHQHCACPAIARIAPNLYIPRTKLFAQNL